jgi:hypothetical protein
MTFFDVVLASMLGCGLHQFIWEVVKRAVGHKP